MLMALCFNPRASVATLLVRTLVFPAVYKLNGTNRCAYLHCHDKMIGKRQWLLCQINELITFVCIILMFSIQNSISDFLGLVFYIYTSHQQSWSAGHQQPQFRPTPNHASTTFQALTHWPLEFMVVISSKLWFSNSFPRTRTWALTVELLPGE